MRILFKGKDIGEWSGRPKLAEAREIKAELGMLPNQFVQALEDADPDAMSMLVAIMLNRRDPDDPVRWDEIDGEFDDVDVELTPEEEKKLKEAEAKKAAEARKANRGKRPQLRSVRLGESETESRLADDEKPATSKTSTGRSRRTRPDSGESTD